MNANDVTPTTPSNDENAPETNDTASFAAGSYFRRTRDVLANQFKEASKVQADTRSALLEVWRDMATDLRGQVSSFEESAKRRASSLIEYLPFASKPKAEDAEATEAPASETTTQTN